MIELSVWLLSRAFFRVLGCNMFECRNFLLFLVDFDPLTCAPQLIWVCCQLLWNMSTCNYDLRLIFLIPIPLWISKAIPLFPVLIGWQWSMELSQHHENIKEIPWIISLIVNWLLTFLRWSLLRSVFCNFLDNLFMW